VKTRTENVTLYRSLEVHKTKETILDNTAIANKEFITEINENG
jgi:hypothetical protein